MPRTFQHEQRPQTSRLFGARVFSVAEKFEHLKKKNTAKCLDLFWKFGSHILLFWSPFLPFLKIWVIILLFWSPFFLYIEFWVTFLKKKRKANTNVRLSDKRMQTKAKKNAIFDRRLRLKKKTANKLQNKINLFLRLLVFLHGPFNTRLESPFTSWTSETSIFLATT